MASGTIKYNGWKLLWQNPNPSLNFQETTLPISLSDYTEVKLVCLRNATTLNNALLMPEYIYDVANMFATLQTMFFGFVDASNKLARRFIHDITSNSITIGIANVGTSTTTVDASVLIPYRIYAR